MIHLTLNESDWSRSIKYWKELTKRIFVSRDDQKKVDFLDKIIFNSSGLKNNVSIANEIETKEENDNGQWGGKVILNFVRNSFWQTPKDLAIKTTRTTTSSDGYTSGTTIRIDPRIKKFIVEPVE